MCGGPSIMFNFFQGPKGKNHIPKEFLEKGVDCPTLSHPGNGSALGREIATTKKDVSKKLKERWCQVLW